MARRLPIYVLIDASGSMHGKAIQEVKNGLETLLESLQQDPYALGTVWLSLISYGREARVLVPLTELDLFALPKIDVPQTAPTNLGEGLELLLEQYDKEVVKGSPERKGDWLPILVVMTDGVPTDVKLYKETARKIATATPRDGAPSESAPTKYRFGRVVACAAGPEAKAEILKELTDEVVELERMDGPGFAAFCQFVSDTIGYCSQAPTREPQELPPPPPGMRFV